MVGSIEYAILPVVRYFAIIANLQLLPHVAAMG